VELCPTLLKTFRALDHIEGLNVDAEASFDKFSVKVEIARLLIRLWRHPNGKCRQSIVDLPAEEICKFASSVAAAIGYLLDDACQRYSDVVKLSRQVALSRQDQAFQEKQLRGAVSGFLCGRTLLLLLFRLSAVDEIAKAIGSGSSASDMASMLVHFLDILAHSDGGTHTDMDARQGDRTILLWQRSSAMTPADKTKLAASVVSARNHARQGTGLDVSEVCHLLLALASRWFAKSQQNGKSALVSELVSRDDCDIVKYRNIADRLIPDESSANENPGVAVFRHDGYVHSTLFPKDENAGQVSEAQRGHMRSAKKCHLTHGEISALARRDDVDKFLNSLEAEMKRTEQSESVQMKSTSETLDIIMSAESSSDEAKYGLVLSPWVVSSEEFSAGDNSSRFLHYFDKTARDRGAMGSGKTLVLEARKCHKGIPRPHPNSAVFVCFAEERMDLCRAVVTGPVDTPYAHGIFTFDVYFPPSFPRIPPLVQFMTTGGGQVRFGPNLYQDGKVCLSLLGTFHAQDESQQWNPRISSLAQILLSIQTQLLTKDPYFLEPGHEAMMHNATGRDASMRYNMKRRLDTLRHAILEPLIEAPLGSEEVVQRHFAFCRRRIAVQARRWTVEAQGTSLAGRFEKVYGQILSRLSSLSTGLLEEISPLEATSEDIQFLSARDSTFLKYNADTDRKPAAVPARYAGDTPSTSFAANPWATDSSGGAVQGHTSTAGKTDTSDDEDDFYS
jgi:ubiquitin-protein ligase